MADGLILYAYLHTTSLKYVTTMMMNCNRRQ